MTCAVDHGVYTYTKDLMLKLRVEETCTYYFKVQTANCGTVESKTCGCPIFDRRVQHTEKAVVVLFCHCEQAIRQVIKLNLARRVTTLYIHDIDTRNLRLVSVRQRPI